MSITEHNRRAHEIQAEQLQEIRGALAHVIADVAHEVSPVRMASDITWQLGRVYSCAGRLPECFALAHPSAPEDTSICTVDMDAIKRWRLEFFEVGESLCYALRDVHRVLYSGAEYGSVEWDRLVKEIVSCLRVALEELEELDATWRAEYSLTGNGE